MSIGLNANLDGTGSVQIGGSDAIQLSTGLNAIFPQTINTPNTFGFKNRIINGQMQIAQRSTSATITAGSTIAAGYSTVDRFYVYCTGANVTAAQVAGSGATKNRLQITGAASVTAIGVGQRIESLNSYDLAGATATLSVDLANSLLTTVTWTAYYANTTDTFGTLASPTRTQISTGTFTVNSTVTRYNTQISIPAAATTGIEIVFTVGAQISGTFTIGNVQLEESNIATTFDYRSYGTELNLAQRYFEKIGGTTAADIYYIGGGTSGYNFSTTIGMVYKRVAPTVAVVGTWTVVTCNQPSVRSTTEQCITLGSSWTGTTGSGSFASTTSAYLTASAEL